MFRIWIVFSIICAVNCSISYLDLAENDPEERRTNNYGYVEYKKGLVMYINSLNTTWKADTNRRFHGKSFDTVRRLMGCVRKRADRPKLPVLRLRHLLGDESIPKSFDAREQWPQCPTIAEIRDQSNCGSCWAFGATEAMSDRVCIASEGRQKPHISADDLLACCKECGNGCFGGDPRSAWQFWVDRGLVTGGNYTTHSGCLPYPFPPCDHHVNGTLKPCPHKLNPTPKCVEKCQSAYTKTYSEDKYFGQQAYSVEEHVQSIQKELMTRGPVEAAFEVYEDFEVYKSGVYQHHKGESMGGHAVRIIGWGEDEKTGTPYWLVANSWNTEWGERGLFRIKRGTNECGIEDDITAGTPKLNDVRSFRYYSNLERFFKYDRE